MDNNRNVLKMSVVLCDSSTFKVEFRSFEVTMKYVLEWVMKR